jgi:hypothetical protein
VNAKGQESKHVSDSSAMVVEWQEHATEVEDKDRVTHLPSRRCQPSRQRSAGLQWVGGVEKGVVLLGES